MSCKIILTVDYEIWGNGTGSFKKLVYEPAHKMLEICDTYNAKLTIFAEMGHYWAMKRYEYLFKNEIILFENQLKKAVANGHDVQLHLHPQWEGALYKHKKWNLNYNKWACSELTFFEINKLLKKGKNDLEKLLIPIKKDYKCIAFRAGGWCALPSRNLVKALIENGFYIDSSVAKGQVLKSNLFNIDYTDAKSEHLTWRIDLDNINFSDSNGKLMEFPIFSSRKFLPLKFIDKNIIKLNKKIRSIKRDRSKGPVFLEQKKDFLSILLRRFRGEYYQNDFCTITSQILIRNLLKVQICAKKCIPLVFISHTKNFIDHNNFEQFVRKVSKIENYEFSTFLESYILMKK